MQIIEIPDCIQLRNERLIVRKAYEEINFNKKKSDKQMANEINLRNNSPAGHINRKIRMQMSRILSNWMLSLNEFNSTKNYDARYTFTFITLTLPSKQVHTDKELHRLALDRFITTIKRKYKVVNYLWRAERQKNGNLHYHIIADKKIHWYDLRTNWNSIMNDLGYIDSYRINQKQYHNNGFRCRIDALKYWSYDKQLAAYKKGVKENWSNPNSTDIHKLKGIKNAINYVMKYVSKSDEVDSLQKLDKALELGTITTLDYQIKKDILLKKLEDTKINGRVWGCSDDIKNLKDPKIIVDASVFQLISQVNNDSNTTVVQKDDILIMYNDNLMDIVKQFPYIKKEVSNHYLQQYYLLYDRAKIKPKFVLTSPLYVDEVLDIVQVKQLEMF